jgi:archaellum biogenesis protein FlaJ (TadC family)
MSVFDEAVAFTRELATFIETEQRGIQRVIAPILNVVGHPNIVLQNYPPAIVNAFNARAERVMMEMIEMEDRVNDMIHRFIQTYMQVLVPANQAPADIREALSAVATRLQHLRGELNQMEEFFLNYRHYFEEYPDEPQDTTFEEFFDF